MKEMRIISVIFLTMFLGVLSAQAQQCPENDTCSVPLEFEQNVLFAPDCDGCSLGESEDYYFLFSVDDVNQFLVIEEWGDLVAGPSLIDFNLYYLGNTYDYCDSVSSGSTVASGTNLTDTVLTSAFAQTGKYIVHINTNVPCTELYLALADTSACYSNAGDVSTNSNCMSGVDLYNGYSQSFCLNATDCWTHWYNLCLSDTTEMTININSVNDSAYYSLYILDSYIADSSSCGFIGDLKAGDFIYYADSLLDSVFVEDSILPGNYTLLIAYEEDYIYNCVNLTFEFDQTVSGCNITYDCPENDTCASPIAVDGCYLFSGFCDTCSVSDNDYFFSFTVEAENSFIVVNEMMNEGYSYILTQWDTLLNPCVAEYFGDTIAAGYTTGEIGIALDTTGYFILQLDSLPNCPSFDICQIDPIDTCETCIGSFAPVPGNKYLVGAWVKDETLGDTTSITTYEDPRIIIHFTLDNGGTTSDSTVGPFKASGHIIDGWQRIEEMFTIPANAIDMEIELTTVGDSALFDDIRVFPFDASMKTFVYDPVNMRLAAELDERHYATFYEYDEEGKLVRIKKETERGVMTIQETKSNASK
jgi:hypothetical protein